MKTIKITTNATTKILEVAEISQMMDFLGLCIWTLKKPIKLDGREVATLSHINFENASLDIDGKTFCGNTSLFVSENGGVIRCRKEVCASMSLLNSAEIMNSPIELSDIHGNVGPFSYTLSVHFDYQNPVNSYFAIEVDLIGIKILDGRIDASHPEISFGGSVGPYTVKLTIGVDFNGGRVYFKAELRTIFINKTYSVDLYNWKNNEILFTPVAKSAANSSSGWISIENEGGYVAKFDVSYMQNGKRITEESGDFTAGVTKVIDIPSDATDIVLHAWDAWFIKSWTEIFSKHFDGPVRKKYKVTGTTLHPDYEELRV